MYNIDYFIKKFKAIPENKFTTGVFESRYDDKKCFLGHCMSRKALDIAYKRRNEYTNVIKPTKEETQTFFSEVAALCELINPENRSAGSLKAISVNNGDDPLYQQSTPKQRILAFLYDLKQQKMNVDYVLQDSKEIESL